MYRSEPFILPAHPLLAQLVTVILFVLPSFASAQQPGLITPIGTVEVADADNGYVIKLDDRVIHSVAGRDGLAPRLIDHFSDCAGYSEILVCERAVHDTSCSRRALFLVAVDGKGGTTVTDEIRYCVGADRSVQRSGSRVTIHIVDPADGTPRGKAKRRSWVFERGSLKPRKGR